MLIEYEKHEIFRFNPPHDGQAFLSHWFERILNITSLLQAKGGAFKGSRSHERRNLENSLSQATTGKLTLTHRTLQQ